MGKATQSIDRKQSKAALHFLKEALNVDPRHDKLRRRLVKQRCQVAIDFLSMEPEERIELCREAKDMAPSIAESYANLGKAHLLAKNYADARAMYSEAVKRD